MVGYITLGVSDVSKSGNFYEQLFAMLGAKRVFDETSCIAWAKDENSVIFTILTPENGQPATAGNGTMIALQAESELQVDSLHKKALDLGASDGGAPGLRAGGYYCAYIRDFDGNKINFHFNPKK
ncbi:VOC family protein [Aliikangiella marina]|uniref:VOC family protein n=1 Tax=Aliikangiella marina TaxID=1712262 RepID=A0A545TIY2_9GAMM|nr:VOC family protein [Aliikangiella marina]TQV77180.1 VOC family protein [Aliikangiella marina]